MIQVIQPQENFPVSRQLADPSDSGTYYVRAIITNARTGAAITTLNLTLVGDQLYSALWYTPVDSSGRGLYVNVKTSVYTDSGYTVKSPNYYDELDTYVILDRFSTVQGLATQISALLGSGQDIDYKKIKKIVDDAISGLPKPAAPADLAPVIAAIQAVPGAIPRPEKPVPVDFTPVISSLEAVKSLIRGLPPPTEPVDLSPVLEAIRSIPLAQELEKLTAEVRRLSDLSDKTNDMQFKKAAESLTALSKRLAPFAGLTDLITSALGARAGEDDEEEEKPTPKLNSFGRIINRS